ncbi:DUF3053 family protein [Klebsiella aerogenes]|nr:DUF3053 family protein [Klebsiella aerogenes]
MHNAKYISRLLIILIASLLLSGCDTKDSQQCQTFTEHLQQHILSVPLMTAPPLTSPQEEAFGPYANNYKILSDYGIASQHLMTGWPQHFNLMNKVYTAQFLLDYREDLAELLETQQAAALLLKKQFEHSQEQYKKLELSGELATTFQQAFDKTVAHPHEIISRVVTTTGKILNQEIEMADFIKAQNARIEGPQGKYAIFPNPHDQQEYSKKVKALVANMKELSMAGQQIQETVGISATE